MHFSRLRDLREDAELKQTEVANLLKVGLSSYQRYERGELEITLSKGLELANHYKVSLDYITGRTNDKRGLTRTDLPQDEAELLRKYRTLSEIDKARVLERIDILAENEVAEADKFRGAI